MGSVLKRPHDQRGSQAQVIRKLLPWAVKLALSAGLIWFLLRKVDLGDAMGRLGSGDPLLLAAALAVLLVQFPLAGLRWRAVLAALGEQGSVLGLMRLFWIGNFFNLVLPGAVGGDAIRMWQSNRSGLALQHAINSVMLERVVILETLLLLVTATIPVLTSRVGPVPGAWAFPLLSALGAGGIGFLMLLDRLPSSLRRWRVVQGMAHLAADTRRLFLRPLPLLITAVWAVLGHINLSLVVYVAAQALDVPVAFLDCLTLVPPVVLVMSLPISIAGWGARELAMVTAFHLVGIPGDAALAVSVAYGLLSIVAGLPGGVLFLLARRRPADVAV